MNNQGFEMNENGGRTYGSTDELQNSPASGGQLPRTRNNNSRNPRDNNGDKHLAIELESQNEPSGLRRSQKKTENNPEVVVDSTSPHVVKHIDLDDDGVTPNIVARIVVGVRRGFYQAVIQNKKKVNIFLVVSTVILYNAFLITSIIYNDNYNQYDQNDDPTDNNKGYYIDWCNGVGILIIITVFVYWCFFYYLILRGLFGKQIKRGILDPIQKIAGPIVGKWYFSYALGLLCLAGAVTFVVVDAQGQEQRLISAGGIVVLLIIGLLLSKNPGRIKWSQVFIGIGLQFVFGLIILRWNTGRQIFDCISQKVKIFLDFTNEGSFFVYGYLAEGVNTTTTMDGIMLPQIFVFKSLSVIFFFSFFISLLYHYGAMMWVITKLGWFLQVTIGTTAAESMNAAANIFIGQTEAPILIKPFLNDMTKSELHAVMVGGFSTIAGSVMGAYISFGIDPSYLLSASIMAAPAALAVSKLFYPEDEDGVDNVNDEGEDAPDEFEEKESDQYLTQSQIDNIMPHMKINDTESTFTCAMPGCTKKFAHNYSMQQHLFNCIEPDFLLCKECKFRIHDTTILNSHWGSEWHQNNIDILRRREIAVSPQPVVNFYEEAREAAKDPLAYKATHCSTSVIGSYQVPIYDVRGVVEEIEPFPDFITYSGDLPVGTLWCSESSVSPQNQCKNTVLHNCLWGPQTELKIPVTFQDPTKTKDVTYSLPITGSFDCQTTGTRSVGMSVKRVASRRFVDYLGVIKASKSARKKFEEDQRDITDEEFKSLFNKFRNLRKYRHFAAADCSPENIVFSILSSYENKDRCFEAEAYHQYALQTCDEASGGLDELPEYTKVSRTTAEQIKSITLKTEGNALDAAAQGAAQGVMLIGNIVANVIAFMAFVAFLNAMVSWIGGLVGLDISFETILGKVFVPAAYLIGVDTQEVEDVALLLGLKTVVNEFVAYGRMVQDMGCLLSPRSRAIATYGLCSFANFSSIGIQLGGIGFMAPHRRTDLAKTIWYAFLAGTFCGLLNACMAGMLISELGYPNLPDGCPIRNT